MKLFPTNTYTFKLFGEETEALDRLKRRTEFSESLSSQCTDKSFRGIIDRNSFRIISSEIGKGALCVLTGKIENKTGEVKIEINKPFRILFSFILCFPLIGIALAIVVGREEIPLLLPFIAILQTLMIRFLFIEIAFRILSKRSLHKLRDVLDLETLKKNSN
ncbi:MAG: hypothetical protein KA215_07695 [Flavobacterium sp.]|jgi:hypothetical protein|nr:hypothetical protein [Flavobacterium sp.]HQV36164.1 hypothetical protein [Flavobacterium sp.]HQX02956.1 hypothetical protein [Flavobacterium sp.]HRZ31390.1 hypothetical protein [Flavobacterium sp.]